MFVTDNFILMASTSTVQNFRVRNSCRNDGNSKINIGNEAKGLVNCVNHIDTDPNLPSYHLGVIRTVTSYTHGYLIPSHLSLPSPPNLKSVQQ